MVILVSIFDAAVCLKDLLSHSLPSIYMFPVAVSFLCRQCVTGCHVFSHQEAIETFKEALKFKPDFIDAYKSLGQAYRYSSGVVS